MVVIIVLLTFVVFVIIDLTLRLILRRLDEARRRKERQAALDIGLRLDVSSEAKSLKSVKVKQPKATILAVDDEPVVLDSFRKILVLAGYSVDTVETGPEALKLIQESDYDFVFTDLKMPEFDGLEVTKAVKHLRPDVDVIMITGYASVDSAVDAMKFGAMDYVEKPFTEDELVEFVNRALIRRQARIEKQRPPKVHLVTTASPQVRSEHVFNVPANVFVSPAHVWVHLEKSGEVRAGMDDFVRKTIGEIERVGLPRPGRVVRKGESLFTVKQKTRSLSFPSPISGRVSRLNEALIDHPEKLAVNPYELGWVCQVEADNLPAELESLRIGEAAVAWYREEIDRLAHLFKDVQDPSAKVEPPDDVRTMSDEAWNAFSSAFLRA